MNSLLCHHPLPSACSCSCHFHTASSRSCSWTHPASPCINPAGQGGPNHLPELLITHLAASIAKHLEVLQHSTTQHRTPHRHSTEQLRTQHRHNISYITAQHASLCCVLMPMLFVALTYKYLHVRSRSHQCAARKASCINLGTFPDCCAAVIRLQAVPDCRRDTQYTHQGIIRLARPPAMFT